MANQEPPVPFSDEVYNYVYPGWDRTAAAGDWREQWQNKIDALPGWQEQKGPDQVVNEILDELEAKYAEMGERYTEFEEENPFSFDEALARASAEERFSPYYKAELSDFVSGVERQRESITGERELLDELNRIKIGEERRMLDEAIKKSEEGYAGSGLFFSGERKRETGLKEIAGAERRERRELKLGREREELGRERERLGQKEKTFRRKLGAEKQSQMERDIEEQRRQERAQWEAERMEFLGPEFAGEQLYGGGLEQFLKSAYS